ncbi:major tail protein [Microcystis phage Mwe-Yong1]|nr:major tail protein [Microcystis phage Mwe-Yong1]
MGKPFEIIPAPFTLYLAPVGTAFPVITAAPSGSWTKVGTSGDRNYSEDGVTVAHSQAFGQARPVGATGPVKAWRTEEDLMVSLTLWDMTLEQYAVALNGNDVAATAAGVGTAGFKKINLYQGGEVELMSLLVRGDVSPYGASYKSQYEIPVCYQSGSPEPAFSKNGPAGLALQFTALEDPDAATPAERFGRLVIQHQVALTE